jgi:hypothetical protein
MEQTVDINARSAVDHEDQRQADLYRRLNEVQRLEHRRRWVRHLSLAVIAMIVMGMVLAACDFYLELSTAVRGLGLLAILATGVVLLVRAQRECRYAAEQAAADVEAAFPRYGQRLRTAFDYADHPLDTAPASPALLGALNTETHQIAQVDDFRQASPVSGLYWAVTGCLLLLVGCGVSLLAVPELRLTAGRMLLLPIEYTTVLLHPIDQPVAMGQDVAVKIEVVGRPVCEASIRFRGADTKDDWAEQPFVPTDVNPEVESFDLHGPLAATIVDCQHDFDVEILAGPRPFPIQRIHVLQPLKLLGFTASVQPPAYTGRQSETFDSETFSVWEGSQVDLRFELNQMPMRAELIPERLADSGEKAEEGEPGLSPIELDMTNNVATAKLCDVRHSMRFTLDAESLDGIALESPRYHIRVQLDKKPEIRFVSPDEPLEVIATTEVPLAIEAGDDLGVTKVGVSYKLNDGETRTLWEQDCESPQDSLHAAEALFLEDHELTYRDAVTYYAFAEDRYFDQSRRVSTPLRFIDIRPFKREFEVTEAPPGGT